MKNSLNTIRKQINQPLNNIRKQANNQITDLIRYHDEITKIVRNLMLIKETGSAPINKTFYRKHDLIKKRTYKGKLFLTEKAERILATTTQESILTHNKEAESCIIELQNIVSDLQQQINKIRENDLAKTLGLDQKSMEKFRVL